MERKVNVVEDLDGNKIVFIHDSRFKGNRSVEWSDVEEYLKQYVGDEYTIEDTKDMVYIGADLPDILKRNIIKVQNMDGTNMILALPCLYLEMMEKWKNTMCFM